MKKLLSAALAAAMLLGLAACSSAPAESTPASQPAAGSTPASEPADAVESDYENILERGQIIIGITIYEPMNYYGEDGALTGFDTELATDVCSKYLSVEPVFEVIDWNTKFVELESGSIDAVWNGMTLTDDIKANQACSDAYAMNAQVIVMKKDNSYESTASLADGVIAVEQGSAGADVVAADPELSKAEPAKKATQAECLTEVEAGTADAAVLDLTLAQAMTGEGTDYEDLVIVDELTHEEYGVAFRKGSDLPEYVNNAFKALVANGRMQELSDRYGVSLTEAMLAD